MLSVMQTNAVKDIIRWYMSDDQFYVLAGYAGTGKTFLIQYIIDELKIAYKDVMFMTFTGKAALVLTQKSGGKFTCHTAHSCLYEAERLPGGGVQFSLRNKEDFKHIKLVVFDECSMPDEQILADLLSLGLKILFVGDHGQLEPIGKVTWLYDKLQDADFTLTEIHRQAEGNPIIHLSMLARQGKRIELGNYNKQVLVTSKRKLKSSVGLAKSLLSADQVICGYNKTRDKYNKIIRQKLGYESDYPVEGDKLICLRNNWTKNIKECSLVNGLVGHARNVVEKRGNPKEKNHILMDFEPDFTPNSFKGIKALYEPFNHEPVKLFPNQYSMYEEMDFGYAITCHKAQGSQWNNVLVINEAFGDDPNRWLYTALTRASNKLILCK